jgi:predicted PurR-regulated permease PerM
MANNIKVTNAFQIGLLGGLGVLTALVLGNMVATIASIITYVFAAIFIALGLDPIVSFIEKRWLKRPFAILTVVIVFFGVVGGLIWAVTPSLVRQSANFIEQAPLILGGISQIDLVVSLDDQFGGAITKTLTSTGEFLGDSKNWPTMLGGVVQVSLSIFNGFFAGLIVVILAIYFMASLDSFKHWIYKLVNYKSRENFINISEQVANSVGRYVMGQMTIAFINATLGFIVMSIVGVPFPLLLAFIAFVFALIPLVGPVSGAVVISLVALSASPMTALVIAVYYAIYLQLEAYLISPRVMRKAVDVPGAVVVVAALAGGALLGVLGALVAIPVAASIILIIRQVWMPRQNADAEAA